MNSILGHIDAALLAGIFVCSVWYLNASPHKLLSLKAVAFSTVAGCAAGRAAIFLYPPWEVEYAELIPHLRVTLDAGMLLVFLAIIVGKVRSLLMVPPMRRWHREVLEACRIAQTPADWELVRAGAIAALRDDAIEHRIESPAVNDAFIEHRFQRGV